MGQCILGVEVRAVDRDLQAVHERTPIRGLQGHALIVVKDRTRDQVSHRGRVEEIPLVES